MQPPRRADADSLILGNMSNCERAGTRCSTSRDPCGSHEPLKRTASIRLGPGPNKHHLASFASDHGRSLTNAATGERILQAYARSQRAPEKHVDTLRAVEVAGQRMLQQFAATPLSLGRSVIEAAERSTQIEAVILSAASLNGSRFRSTHGCNG